MIKRSAAIWRALCSAAVLLAAGCLCSCSTKKNTAASRNYQAFITRYNVYHNGIEHYRETLRDMEGKFEDDFTSVLPVNPAQNRGKQQVPQPSGDFVRSIEKAQKAIQLHSIKRRPKRKPGRSSDPAYKAWLKREEYNPFLHNAWLLMGKSQYQNGDFLGAASTFYYISKHFPWLEQTVTEARLWQAQSYIAADWLYEAEGIITRIKPEQLTSKQLDALYNTTAADLYVHTGEYDKALPFLEKAAASSSGPQKTRLNFLLGQVYSLTGNGASAYQAFKRAGSSASAPYRTKFNARIKQSEVFTGANIESEVKSLRRMTRYDRNKEYLDQIYYAIGNLYLSRRDTANAIANYRLAAEKSTRNGIEKAISQITLGGIYFNQGRYDLAQPCYSEAVPLLPESYPDRKQLQRRSDVLDELAVYAQNVTLQDSLLQLAALSPEEQMKVAQRLADELKKREKEEAELARREEMRAQAEANAPQLQNGANAPTTFQMNNDDSWYFYNSTTVKAGRTDFQKRWGSRKLEDDWRRRNKSSFSFSDFDAQQEGDAEADVQPTDSIAGDSSSEPVDTAAAARRADPHFPEYYLAQIPNTDVEKVTANDIVQEGLYNMGLILKNKLEDPEATRSEWNRLMERYPDNVYRLEVYYNLYLMYMQMGRPEEAEHWRQLILSDFPESNYGLALANPDYIKNLREMPARQQELYEQTYEHYLNNENGAVHDAYDKMMADYPLSKIMPKFMFLHALAFVTENRPEEFSATLREMLERYPDTDMTPMASSFLASMAKGRKLQGGGSNLRGMLWDIRLTNDSTLLANDPDAPIEFDTDEETPHMLVLVFPTDSVSANQLLFDVARHNFNSFVVKDFDLEQMNFGRLGMLLVKGFENMAELRHYRSMIDESRSLQLPSEVRPVMISVANFEQLITRGRSLDEYFRFLEEQAVEQAEDAAFGPADEENDAENAGDDLLEEVPVEGIQPEELPVGDAPESEPDAEPEPIHNAQ